MPDETELQTGRTETLDPVTGERQVRTFQYRPTPRIAPSPMDSLMKAAQDVYQTAPLEDAEKAVSAAIQYQGLRAYQRDLAGGMSANEALVRNGPMMFYQRPSAIAPMVRATAPAPSVATVPIPGGGQAVTYGNTMQIMRPPPGITPYQQESLKIQRERMAAQERAAAEKPKPLPEDAKAFIAIKKKQLADAEKWLTDNPLKPKHGVPFTDIQFGGNVEERQAYENQAELLRNEITRLASGVTTVPPASATAAGKKLDFDTAARLFREAGNDRKKAEAKAKELGYTF